MKKTLFALALSVLAMGVVGCGTKEVVTEQVPAATSQAVKEEKTEEKVEDLGPVKVVHELGETEVARNPKRVVVFDYGVLDSLDYLNVEVVGVVQSNVPAHLEKYTADTYTAIGSLKEPNLETIYEIQPDLIIISGRQVDYYEELTKIAPTIHLGIDNTNYLESLKANMDYVGQIFGKEAEVTTKIAKIEDSMKAINEKATATGKNALVTLANEGSFSVYGEGSRFGIIHDGFGFPAVDTTIESSTHGQKASFEYIVEKNPDYLFVIDRGAAIASGGETSAQQLFENDLMKTTKAYQEGNIVYLDATTWYTAGGGLISTQMMIDEVSAAIAE